MSVEIIGRSVLTCCNRRMYLIFDCFEGVRAVGTHWCGVCRKKEYSYYIDGLGWGSENFDDELEQYSVEDD